MIPTFWNGSGSRLSTCEVITSGMTHLSNLNTPFTGLFSLFIGFAGVLNGLLFY